MKMRSLTVLSLVSYALLAAVAITPAVAQNDSGQSDVADVMAPALPPPDIDDPGVRADIQTAVVSPADGVDDPPETIGHTPTVAADGLTETSLPQITVRTDATTGDRVEETRENGKLVRLVVTPKNAPPYVLHDANGDGRVDAKDSEGPVQPVYWELFSWD